MSEIINSTTNEVAKEGFSFSFGLPFQAEGTGSAAGDVVVTVLGNVIIGGALVAAVNGIGWCGKQVFGAAEKAINEAKAKNAEEKKAEEAAPKAEPEVEVVNADGTAAK